MCRSEGHLWPLPSTMEPKQPSDFSSTMWIAASCRYVLGASNVTTGTDGPATLRVPRLYTQHIAMHDLPSPGGCQVAPNFARVAQLNGGCCGRHRNATCKQAAPGGPVAVQHSRAFVQHAALPGSPPGSDYSHRAGRAPAPRLRCSTARAHCVPLMMHYRNGLRKRLQSGAKLTATCSSTKAMPMPHRIWSMRNLNHKATLSGCLLRYKSLAMVARAREHGLLDALHAGAGPDCKDVAGTGSMRAF